MQGTEEEFVSVDRSHHDLLCLTRSLQNVVHPRQMPRGQRVLNGYGKGDGCGC